jgi:hypothetical protein
MESHAPPSCAGVMECEAWLSGVARAGQGVRAGRSGMIEGYTLVDYLILVAGGLSQVGLLAFCLWLAEKLDD